MAHYNTIIRQDALIQEIISIMTLFHNRADCFTKPTEERQEKPPDQDL
jgi:hypothetical protein